MLFSVFQGSLRLFGIVSVSLHLYVVSGSSFFLVCFGSIKVVIFGLIGLFLGCLDRLRLFKLFRLVLFLSGGFMMFGLFFNCLSCLFGNVFGCVWIV